MSIFSSASGQVSLVDWDLPLSVNDVVSLVIAVRKLPRARAGPGFLIAVLRRQVPEPTESVRSAWRAALPAILDQCREFLVVIEGSDADRKLLRSMFRGSGTTSIDRIRRMPRLFRSRDEAFSYVEALAPHDVLELRRMLIRGDSQPPHSTR